MNEAVTLLSTQKAGNLIQNNHEKRPVCLAIDVLDLSGEQLLGLLKEDHDLMPLDGHDSSHRSMRNGKETNRENASSEFEDSDDEDSFLQWPLHASSAGQQ
ncbi:hypothetical protein I5L01_15275, partial [Erythrobacter sp. YJ-T3-07]|uniref:hypothetical protein n=1 Tax=Erythrobacter sp. YJ-T3-07 TaxID=2793063 RepID=UPI001A3349C0